MVQRVIEICRVGKERDKNRCISPSSEQYSGTTRDYFLSSSFWASKDWKPRGRQGADVFQATLETTTRPNTWFDMDTCTPRSPPPKILRCMASAYYSYYCGLPRDST